LEQVCQEELQRANADCATRLETELMSAAQAVDILTKELSELEANMSGAPACGEESREQVQQVQQVQQLQNRVAVVASVIKPMARVGANMALAGGKAAFRVGGGVSLKAADALARKVGEALAVQPSLDDINTGPIAYD
jgi:hypothetical protein